MVSISNLMIFPCGAKVRDGRLWSGYIDEAIYTYAEKTDISFGSQHWPVWGTDEVTEFWLKLIDKRNMGHELPKSKIFRQALDFIAQP